MNKLYYLVSLLIISIMLSGCRSEVLVKPTPALKKLKTITSGYTFTTGDVIDRTTAFDYNSDGKLARVINSSYKTDTTSFTYSRDTVFAVFKSTEVHPNQIIRNAGNRLIVLNSRGYISTSTSSQNGQFGFIETYQYDKSGYCIKLSQILGPDQFVTDFKYSGGNLISVVQKWGQHVFSEEMTYYPDKINTLIPNTDSFFYYFGNESKNLMKTQHRVISGIPDDTFNFQYEFDANNYVTKRIRTDNSGQIYWDKYTYQ